VSEYSHPSPAGRVGGEVAGELLHELVAHQATGVAHQHPHRDVTPVRQSTEPRLIAEVGGDRLVEPELAVVDELEGDRRHVGLAHAPLEELVTGGHAFVAGGIGPPHAQREHLPIGQRHAHLRTWKAIRGMERVEIPLHPRHDALLQRLLRVGGCREENGKREQAAQQGTIHWALAGYRLPVLDAVN
jgi:hypothetical protein